MSIAAGVERMTAEQFHASCAGRNAELVRGEVVELPPEGTYNGLLAGLLNEAIAVWNAEHRVGVLVSAAGYLVARQPDTVRAPDGGFILRERLQSPVPRPYSEVPPDLVFEIASPSDRSNRVLANVGEWLDAGVRVVWVIWPETQRAWTCRGGGDVTVLSRADVLTAEDVLPGFGFALEELFGVVE